MAVLTPAVPVQSLWSCSKPILTTTLRVNPLTTDDECTRHETSAAYYQLAQSVLKIGFALAKGGIGGFSVGCRAHGSCLGWL